MATLRLTLSLLIAAGVAVSACVRATDARDLPGAGAMARDIPLAADIAVVSARVAAGATLGSILQAQHVAAADVSAVVARAASVFDLRKVRAAQPYTLARTAGGVLRRFEYEIDGDRVLRVARAAGDELVASILPIPKTRKIEQ